MSYKKTMREEQKQKLSQNKRAKYQVMDPEQKNALLNRKKEKQWKRILKFMTKILEFMTIAQRIDFEKIVVMSKGQQRKIKGAICNVPVECSQTCNVLPRPPDRSAILLKLKRKLQFRGHVYFQAVRPQFVINALDWLIANNPLYRNIENQCDNIGPELTNLNCPDTDQENIDGPFQLQSNVNREHCNEDVEEQDDPLNEHHSTASETCLQSILPNYPVNLDSTIFSSTGREVFNIASGEGKHPVSLMTDKLCEELSFPVLSRDDLVTLLNEL